MTVLLTIFHWQWSNQIHMCKAYSSPLCRVLCCMCRIQRSGRKTQLFTSTLQPPKSSLPTQKSSAHQLTNEPRVVTSFSEARFTLPDQYVKLKLSRHCQPSLSFPGWTCAAAGSSHTVGSEVSHSVEEMTWKQSRDRIIWLCELLITLINTLRR